MCCEALVGSAHQQTFKAEAVLRLLCHNILVLHQLRISCVVLSIKTHLFTEFSFLLHGCYANWEKCKLSLSPMLLKLHLG